MHRARHALAIPVRLAGVLTALVLAVGILPATAAGGGGGGLSAQRAFLDCLRPTASAPHAPRPAECAANLASQGSQSPAGSPTAMPVCVDQVSDLNSRCEVWSRAFNARGSGSATVDDTPRGFAVNRKGDVAFVATTTKVGQSKKHMTVAALSTKNGATRWEAKPLTSTTTYGGPLALSPDQRTVVVAGAMNYLPSLNANVQTWWYISAWSTSTGRPLWATTFAARRADGETDVPVAVAIAGRRVFVTGYSTRLTVGRQPIEWRTVAFALGTGRRIWEASYFGSAGGQNWPIGLATSPRGDKVFVAGTSEQSQHTGNFSQNYGVIGYSAASGRPLWRRIIRKASDQRPIAMTAERDAVYVTGIGKFGSSEVYDILTAAVSSRSGAVRWTSRYKGASGPASATAIAVSGGHVFVAAGLLQQRVLVPGDMGPNVPALGVVAYNARSGKVGWVYSYAPAPEYYAVPTAMTINAKRHRIYLAGFFGAVLGVHYPVTVAVSTTGKPAWTARYAVRDLGATGSIAGMWSQPIGIATDAAGKRVYDSIDHNPASNVVCAATKASDCPKNTGRANLLLAYAG